MWAGLVLFGGLRGQPVSSPLPLPGAGHLLSLVYGSFLASLQPLASAITSTVAGPDLEPPTSPLYRSLWWDQAHWDNPGSSPTSGFFIMCAKSFLSCRVMYSKIKTWMSSGLLILRATRTGDKRELAAPPSPTIKCRHSYPPLCVRDFCLSLPIYKLERMIFLPLYLRGTLGLTSKRCWVWNGYYNIILWLSISCAYINQQSSTRCNYHWVPWGRNLGNHLLESVVKPH